MANWSPTSPQLKLIKIGTRVERHACAITFQKAQVAVNGPILPTILAAISRLRAPPLCAWTRFGPTLAHRCRRGAVPSSESREAHPESTH
jgi:hypothetical protein